MPNPFSKEKPVDDLEEVEGHFGCYTDGCGKVTGIAFYDNTNKKLTFICPSGHTTSLDYEL